MTLTTLEAKNAKPAGRNYKLTDSRGLYLHVTVAGTKSWRFKYHYGRKEKMLTFGRYPDVGLVAARERADNARRLLREGKDPGFEAQRIKRAQIDAAEATFRKLAEMWLKDHAPLWSTANAVRVRNRIERDLYPEFGNMPIGNIDSVMILRYLRATSPCQLTAGHRRLGSCPLTAGGKAFVHFLLSPLHSNIRLPDHPGRGAL